MATLAQLRSEPYWDREIVTEELDWLGDELCRRTGRPRVAFGSKGNTAHLRGAHRSQEWIVNSRFCTSRTSTVQGGLSATQARHIAGGDFTPGDWGTSANRSLMVEQTTRLRNAMVRGQLSGVTQVIGTLDGRTVVGTRADGSTFSSDDSHLEHWHLTFDRRRLTDRALMERIVAVALGEDDDMTPQQLEEHQANTWQVRNVPSVSGGRKILTGAVGELVTEVLALKKTVAALAVEAPTTPITPQQLAEILAAAEREAREEVAEALRDAADAAGPQA